MIFFENRYRDKDKLEVRELYEKLNLALKTLFISLKIIASL
jgi:hypothetical protein